MWCSVVPKSSDEATPPSRSKHSATLLGSYLYLIGGRNGNLPLKDLWRYNLTDGKWQLLRPSGETPPCLQEHSAVAHRDSIYVFGGEVGFSAGNETPLWVYKVKTNSWRKVKSQKGAASPKGRRGHSALAHRGNMLLYGGYRDLRGSSNELWAFHFESESWHLISSGNSCPPARHKHSAVVHDDSMYIYGGMTDLHERADLWKFDTISKTWTCVKTKVSPGSLHSHAVSKLPSSMLLFGGERDGQPTNDLWRFHFGTESWEKLQTQGVKPQPRSESVALTVSELLFKPADGGTDIGAATGKTSYNGNTTNGYDGPCSSPNAGGCISRRYRGSGSVDRHTNRASSGDRKLYHRWSSGGCSSGGITSPCSSTAGYNTTGEGCTPSRTVSVKQLMTPNSCGGSNLSILKEISKLSQINLSRLSSNHNGNKKCNYSVLSSQESINSDSNSSTASNSNSNANLVSNQRSTNTIKSNSNNCDNNFDSNNHNNSSDNNNMIKSRSINFITQKSINKLNLKSNYNENNIIAPTCSNYNSNDNNGNNNNDVLGGCLTNNCDNLGGCNSTDNNNYGGGRITRDPISVPNFSTLTCTTPLSSACANMLTPIEVTSKLVYLDNEEANIPNDNDNCSTFIDIKNKSTTINNYESLQLKDFHFTNYCHNNNNNENGKQQNQNNNSEFSSLHEQFQPSNNNNKNNKKNFPKSASVRFSGSNFNDNNPVSSLYLNTPDEMDINIDDITSDYASIETSLNRISSTASNYSFDLINTKTSATTSIITSSNTKIINNNNNNSKIMTPTTCNSKTITSLSNNSKIITPTYNSNKNFVADISSAAISLAYNNFKELKDGNVKDNSTIPLSFSNPNYMAPDLQTILSSAHHKNYVKVLNSPPDSVLEDSLGRSSSRQDIIEMKPMPPKSLPLNTTNNYNNGNNIKIAVEKKRKTNCYHRASSASRATDRDKRRDGAITGRYDSSNTFCSSSGLV